VKDFTEVIGFLVSSDFIFLSGITEVFCFSIGSISNNVGSVITGSFSSCTGKLSIDPLPVINQVRLRSGNVFAILLIISKPGLFLPARIWEIVEAFTPIIAANFVAVNPFFSII